MSDSDIQFAFDSESVMARYRHALGEFIHDFVWIEVCIFNLLCATARMSRPIGQALFSGARAEQLIGHIRRCYDARNKVIEPYLDRALAQSIVLNKARNQVVHFFTIGIEDSETEVFATNQFRYLTQNATDIRVSPETLNDMAQDARIISAILMTTEAEMRHPGRMPTIMADMRNEHLQWCYKPSQPAQKVRKGRGAATNGKGTAGG